jgi:hypothetical protein
MLNPITSMPSDRRYDFGFMDGLSPLFDSSTLVAAGGVAAQSSSVHRHPLAPQGGSSAAQFASKPSTCLAQKGDATLHHFCLLAAQYY